MAVKHRHVALGLAGTGLLTLGLWGFWIEPASLEVVEERVGVGWPGPRPLTR
jgi:hypothetical protein